MTVVICVRPKQKGKVYVSADDIQSYLPNNRAILGRIEKLHAETGMAPPNEPIASLQPTCPDNTLGITVRPYGLRSWSDLFTPRQLLCILTFTAVIRQAESEMRERLYEGEKIRATITYLACVLDRLADWNSTLCGWSPESTGGAKIGHTFGRQVLTMVWDFAESGVWGEATGSAELCLDWVLKGLADVVICDARSTVLRGNATTLPWGDACFDAVITDPPYYDNIPYADISDFFYVWLKRAAGHLYPEHFAAETTPKKNEAIADSARHGGDKHKARGAYERMVAQAFAEGRRVLKPNGQIAVVYAHKTTIGWSTLVDALRGSGFTVTEAWPLDTEMKARLRSMDSAALASSIFLAARKRDSAGTGSYENEVRPDLERIVRERVETLWDMGISGADLVIACVGAGLRAFTKYIRVEYGNGEEVPAARFLAEVETVVLETILGKLSKTVGAKNGQTSLAGLDPATRFYILWRYAYRSAELDAGEAIIFANGTHVELDGIGGLSSGARPLLEKAKGIYRLLDYSERGDDKRLGMPSEAGQPAPLIDVLQRTLWLMEKRPGQLDEFLREAQPRVEQMRLVAQALAGPALKGKTESDKSLIGSTQPEQAALGKLLANWRSLIEQAAGPLFK